MADTPAPATDVRPQPEPRPAPTPAPRPHADCEKVKHVADSLRAKGLGWVAELLLAIEGCK